MKESNIATIQIRKKIVKIREITAAFGKQTCHSIKFVFSPENVPLHQKRSFCALSKLQKI
jgi:hypothetical protein